MNEDEALEFYGDATIERTHAELRLFSDADLRARHDALVTHRLRAREEVEPAYWRAELDRRALAESAAARATLRANR